MPSADEHPGSGPTQEEVCFRDIAPMAEFSCWVILAISPFLRWVNGPAVSTDQFVVQVSLVTLALLGAVGLRVYNWRQH